MFFFFSNKVFNQLHYYVYYVRREPLIGNEMAAGKVEVIYEQFCDHYFIINGFLSFNLVVWIGPHNVAYIKKA